MSKIQSSSRSQIPKSASVSGSDFTTTSATAVDITGLTLPVDANKKYRITGAIALGCSSTGGVKLAFTGPTGATLKIANFIGNMSAGNALRSGFLNTLATLTPAPFETFNGTNGPVIFTAYINTGSTSGNIVLQAASGVALQTSTVYIGSTMDRTEVQ